MIRNTTVKNQRIAGGRTVVVFSFPGIGESPCLVKQACRQIVIPHFQKNGFNSAVFKLGDRSLEQITADGLTPESVLHSQTQQLSLGWKQGKSQISDWLILPKTQINLELMMTEQPAPHFAIP